MTAGQLRRLGDRDRVDQSDLSNRRLGGGTGSMLEPRWTAAVLCAVLELQIEPDRATDVLRRVLAARPRFSGSLASTRSGRADRAAHGGRQRSGRLPATSRGIGQRRMGDMGEPPCVHQRRGNGRPLLIRSRATSLVPCRHSLSPRDAHPPGRAGAPALRGRQGARPAGRTAPLGRSRSFRIRGPVAANGRNVRWCSRRYVPSELRLPLCFGRFGSTSVVCDVR
jgi:hypothetical protein